MRLEPEPMSLEPAPMRLEPAPMSPEPAPGRVKTGIILTIKRMRILQNSWGLFKFGPEIILFFKSTFADIPAFDNLDHRDVMNLRIFKVSLVMCRNRHDGTRSVVCQYKITDKQFHLFPVHRIDTIHTL